MNERPVASVTLFPMKEESNHPKSHAIAGEILLGVQFLRRAPPKSPCVELPEVTPLLFLRVHESSGQKPGGQALQDPAILFRCWLPWPRENFAPRLQTQRMATRPALAPSPRSRKMASSTCRLPDSMLLPSSPAGPND